MKVTVILEQGDDGYITAHCPSLKSCWSQGKTREEALINIRESVELYLEPDPITIPSDKLRIAHRLRLFTLYTIH